MEIQVVAAHVASHSLEPMALQVAVPDSSPGEFQIAAVPEVSQPLELIAPQAASPVWMSEECQIAVVMLTLISILPLKVLGFQLRPCVLYRLICYHKELQNVTPRTLFSHHLKYSQPLPLNFFLDMPDDNLHDTRVSYWE